MSAFAVQSQPKQFKKFLTLRTTPGVFMRAAVYNKGSSTVFVQVHDAAAEPAGAAPCIIPFPVNPGTTETFEFRIECAAGVTIAGSSTEDTYTALSTADLYIVADSQ
jgi:hypothetical protein